MSDNGHDLPWSAEQWAELQQLVQNSARKARIASSFLPLHGPLPPGQATVPALEMVNQDLRERLQRWEPDSRLDIDDGKTLRLTTIACDVYLKSLQADDPSLAAARDLLSRAADIVGRLEDAIVFNGQPDADTAPGAVAGGAQVSPYVRPPIYTVRHGQKNPGLLTLHPDPALRTTLVKGVPGASVQDRGVALVASVIQAIQTLEGLGHYGPFACVLGSTLYEAAFSPNHGSLVMPSDRITPFLDGPLLRSTSVPDDQGVVVALAGAPIDLVVGSDVHLTFLQRSIEPRYVLRVSERVVLRIKQPDAACQLRLGSGASIARKAAESDAAIAQDKLHEAELAFRTAETVSARLSAQAAVDVVAESDADVADAQRVADAMPSNQEAKERVTVAQDDADAAREALAQRLDAVADAATRWIAAAQTADDDQSRLSAELIVAEAWAGTARAIAEIASRTSADAEAAGAESASKDRATAKARWKVALAAIQRWLAAATAADDSDAKRAASAAIVEASPEANE